MNRRLAHYRVKCVEDFAKAQPGSINLESYALGFQDAQRIDDLQKELGVLLMARISPESAEQVATLTRKLHHEATRAAFPFRYTRYGVALFGSARLAPEDPEFQDVSRITRGIVSQARVDINSGGGPGVMEAANLGLKEGALIREQQFLPNGVRNHGLTIKLPFEEDPNEHLHIESRFSTFGTRLNEFADHSNAAVSWTGGGGTDLENAFVYQLKQVGHLERGFPLVFKRENWGAIQAAKMQAMFHDRIAQGRKPLISPEDLDLVTLVDSTDEAVDIVLRHHSQWVKDVWEKLDEDSQEKILAA